MYRLKFRQEEKIATMDKQEIIDQALGKAKPYLKGFSVTFIKIIEFKVYLQLTNKSLLDHYIFPKIALETYLSEELNEQIEIIFVE